MTSAVSLAPRDVGTTGKIIPSVFHIEGLGEDGQPIPESSSRVEYVGIDATYKIWQDGSGKWGWHLAAVDNRIIATSSEHYETRAQCLEAIELVRSLSVAPVMAA